MKIEIIIENKDGTFRRMMNNVCKFDVDFRLKVMIIEYIKSEECLVQTEKLGDVISIRGFV